MVKLWSFSKTQRGIKTDGYQNGKFFFKLGSLVPVCFGTRLGVSLAAPKGVSKRMGIKMASFLSFENLTFRYPFVLVPVWAPPILFPIERPSTCEDGE